MISEVILSIRNLKVSFKAGKTDYSILDNLSFDVERGKVFGITGQSGSGKSMTALSMLGLTNHIPDIFVTGSVMYNQNNILDMQEKDLSQIRGKDISIIFQQPAAALNPLIKCGTQVYESIKIHDHSLSPKNIKERVKELLGEVGLKDSKKIVDSFPHEISGGQQQRVMIAMALANNPEIVIADEATSSLDTKTAAEIIELLMKYKYKHGTTLIFISHDTQLLRNISDRILIIEDGRILGNINCHSKDETDLQDSALVYLNASLPLSTKHAIGNNDEYLAVQNIMLEYKKKSWFIWEKPIVYQVLNNISFVLNKGSSLGIFGESGSGKTSIAKVVAGISAPTSGQISINGKILKKNHFENDDKVRRSIQYIFQDALTSFNPKITIGKQWEEVLLYHRIVSNKKQAKEKLLALMAEFGLPIVIYDKYPFQVSGGQLQRAALIRTLLTEPELIIFDESLSSLDMFNQQKMIGIITKAQEKFNFCSIFISHDPKLIRALCDKVIVLENGTITKSGAPEEIL